MIERIVTSHTDECTWKSYKVKVIRKPFLRNIRLRVLTNLKLEIRAAKQLPLKTIFAFLEENHAWIATTYEKMQKYVATLPQYSFAEEDKFLYLGHEVVLRFWDSSHVDLRQHTLFCPKNIQGNPENLRTEIRAFFKQEADTIIFLRAYKIAKNMGIEPKKIRLRDLSSRWGSCSQDGHISLSWKLIASPLSVIDYVIVHEYCHLVHMNHSKDFWKMVELYCPNWKRERNWLRKNAMKLDFLEKSSKLYS